jgi:hypothetical protein
MKALARPIQKLETRFQTFFDDQGRPRHLLSLAERLLAARKKLQEPVAMGPERGQELRLRAGQLRQRIEFGLHNEPTWGRHRPPR